MLEQFSTLLGKELLVPPVNFQVNKNDMFVVLSASTVLDPPLQFNTMKEVVSQLQPTPCHEFSDSEGVQITLSSRPPVVYQFPLPNSNELDK